MTDETPETDRVAGLERELADLRQAHREALLRTGLRAEAQRAGMVDLDGLKLVDSTTLAVDEHGEVAGAAALMASLKRAKPWLFGAAGSSSSTAAVPPAQPPKSRRAADMTYEEWQAARAELLRRL